MGQEAKCRVDFGQQTSEGKALLETGEILFRGEFKLKIAHQDIQKLSASGGRLKVVFPGGTAVFHLGNSASKWADRILHPPSRQDKLGVKAGTKVALLGMQDDDFLRELKERGAEIVRTGADLAFLAAEAMSDLGKLGGIGAGAVWVVYPKGVKSITENNVLAAGRAAGLVDIKVASFSSTHTALKFTRRKSRA